MIAPGSGKELKAIQEDYPDHRLSAEAIPAGEWFVAGAPRGVPHPAYIRWGIPPA